MERPNPLKLDLGCGKSKQSGFWGVDIIPFEGVDEVCDLTKPWPWESDSVEEVHCAHMIEHLKMSPEEPERVHFANELYRVMKPGAKATIVAPMWSSQRAYGDYTHRWPPVTEFWFHYLRKEWRDTQAPHNTLYTCDFDITGGFTVHPQFQTKNTETQQFALAYYKDAAMDLISTWVKRKL